MNYLDIILCIPLLWGGYRGFKKGFIVEVFSLGSIVLAISAGVHLIDDVLRYFFKKWVVMNGKFTPLFVFILIFVITFIVTIFLGRLVKYFIDFTVLGSVDVIIGVAIGIAKWGIIMSFILWGMEYFEIKIPDLYTIDSLLFPIIAPIAPNLLVFVYPSGLSLYEQIKGIKK